MLWRRIVILLMVGYVAFVCLVTMSVRTVDDRVPGLIAAILALGSHYRSASWFSYTTLEKAANVGMFVPIGFLVALQFGRWWAGLLFGLLFSLLIEGIQATLLAATRTASISDVVTNTIGAAIGALLAGLLLWRAAVTSEVPSSSDVPVE
ncbi:VanZ family protein [Microlunatus elymi]|nr:VanZ family protein [Microlunatus elymi]